MKTLAALRPIMEFGAVVLALIVALRLITAVFGYRKKTYRLNFQRQLALLFWPLLCLGVGLPFLASFVFAGTLASYELVLLLAFASLTLGFAAPALALHAQYYVRNHATTVVFDPKANVLEVYEDGVRIPFGRSDLHQVRYVRCASQRLFWSSYEYLQLHLLDGRVVTITSVLMKLGPLAEFLRNANLVNSRRWFCLVRA